jgi:hypothetical protein
MATKINEGTEFAIPLKNCSNSHCRMGILWNSRKNWTLRIEINAS